MKESKQKFKELVTSSFYGVAIGDALGVPVEFSSRSKLDNKPIVHMEGDRAYKQEKGTFSDDTSLTLATAIGLCNKSKSKITYIILSMNLPIGYSMENMQLRKMFLMLVILQDKLLLNLFYTTIHLFHLVNHLIIQMVMAHL